jgi:hypothetical protein
LLCFWLKPLKVERVDMVHQASILQAALAIERGTHQRSTVVTYCLLYKKALVPQAFFGSRLGLTVIDLFHPITQAIPLSTIG